MEGYLCVKKRHRIKIDTKVKNYGQSNLVYGQSNCAWPLWPINFSPLFIALLVIFKEKNGELGPRVRAALKVPDNVRITTTTIGWMTKA